jgi:chromosomal replication initiation ATPase DnaA
MAFKERRLFDPKLPAYHERIFIQGPSNQLAYSWLEKWPHEIDVFSTYLSGEKGAGKKHLSHIWGHKHHATYLNAHELDPQNFLESTKYVVIHVEQPLTSVCEKNLFHAFNFYKANKAHILFTCTQAPNNLNLTLEDLKSRLATCNFIYLDKPDEETLYQLYTLSFKHKGIQINREVVDFLLMRLERSFDVLHNTVTILEQASCSDNRSISIPFVKSVLSL